VPSLTPSTRSSTYSQSVASTTSLDVKDPYYISPPKPDITVGLAHTSFTRDQQRDLFHHQAAGTILSDPHAAPIGFRFPFLVVKAKGVSANGATVSVQNQAAISGACMLRILDDLDKATQLPNPLSPLCFSIVTTGPYHELLAHFQHEGAFHMECLRYWRTTFIHAAYDLVYFLARIMEWGGGKFHEDIMDRLDHAAKSGMYE
jgi:hypothetical protein